MRVSAFTIVRNAVHYDYPVVESIRSALPLVDEFIVAVGNSHDGTRELIQSIQDERIRIIDTVWDESLRSGGLVLSQQTNLAMDHCDGDWLVYVQADEVLHEQDQHRLQKKMHRYLEHPTVEGLSFRYRHFRADYDICDPVPYRRQVRVIRPGIGIRSYGDACGFRRHGRKLRTVASGCWMYHYGFVRPPARLTAKMDYFTSLYDGRQVTPGEESELKEYTVSLASCERFRGSHPAVMQDRIRAKDWATPDVVLRSRWVNPNYWSGMLHKNTRALRRMAHTAGLRRSA